MMHIRSDLAKKSFLIFRISILVLIIIVMLFPIYWIFIASIVPSRDILSVSLSWLFPTKISLENYKMLMDVTNYERYYINSLMIAAITTILTLIVSSIGGYSLARLKYKGKKLLGRLILFTYLIPSALLLIPLFQVINSFGMKDRHISLVISYMTFAIPFCIWMLRGFFLSLPESLEDAAIIDGSSIFGAFVRIIAPLAAPGIVASAMFTFILCWNEFLFALVFVSKDHLRTIPAGVVISLVSSYMPPENWSMVMAASMLASLPVYLLFVFLQKYLVQGMAAGSVKE